MSSSTEVPMVEEVVAAAAVPVVTEGGEAAGVAPATKKPRAPSQRSSKQVNGCQFYVHKSTDTVVGQFLKSLEITQKLLTNPKVDEVPNVVIAHFPWWLENNEAVMTAMRGLQFTQPNSIIGIWTDSTHVGTVTNLMQTSYGIEPKNISTQLVVDYSSKYCQVDGGSYVPTAYSPEIDEMVHQKRVQSRKKRRTPRSSDEELLMSCLAEGEPNDQPDLVEDEDQDKVVDPMVEMGERVGIERMSSNLPLPAMKTITRPTTELLVVGYRGDVSSLFQKHAQCRIPYQVWHQDMEEIYDLGLKPRQAVYEARHPAAIRRHLAQTFSSSARVLELFDSGIDALASGTFANVAPFAPGVYYLPLRAREQVGYTTLDLTSCIYDSIQGKFTKSQLKGLIELVRKVLNHRTSEKNRAEASTKLYATLLGIVPATNAAGEVADDASLSVVATPAMFIATLPTWDQVSSLLGVTVENVEDVYFTRALHIALDLTKSVGETLREKRKSRGGSASSSSSAPVLDENGQPIPPKRRGFNLPVKLSPQLSSFLNVQTDLPRTQVYALVNAYIKEHNLQCPEKRQFFKPDDTLTSLLGTNEPVKYFHLPGLVNQHLPPSKKKLAEMAAAAAAASLSDSLVLQEGEEVVVEEGSVVA